MTNSNNIYNLLKLQLSHSSQMTYHNCARKFEFTKLFNKGVSLQTVPMGAGSALHAGVQSYLTDYNIDKAIYNLSLDYPAEVYADFPVPTRSLEACVATLEDFINSGILYDYELVHIENFGPGREIFFEIHFPKLATHIPFSYIGYIDLLLKNKSTGEILVADIKTHRDNQVTEKAYKFSQQCTPYSLVIGQALGQDTIEQLNILYISMYIDIYKPETKLFYFTKSQADITEWATEIRNDILTIDDRMFNNKPFPRVIDAFPCRTCAFFDHCDERDTKFLKENLDFFFPSRDDGKKHGTPTFSFNLEIS